MTNTYYCICTFYRGDNFRKMFAEIGTIQSLINKEINILALTATATSETAKSIFWTVNVSIIGLSRERHNIKYSVVPMPNMVDVCSALAEELVKMRAETPKTVLFAKLYSNVVIFMQK